MREKIDFPNFIEALNYANSSALDQKTRIQKKGSTWTLIFEEKKETENQHITLPSFSRIADDISYVESKNITFESYYDFLSTDELLVRVEENNMIFLDKINLIKEMIISRYLRITKEEISSLLEKSTSSAQKKLLRKALKKIKEKESIQKKELINKLKDLESSLNNLSYEEIKKLWDNRDEEGFYEDTDEYIMLEYFLKKKKAAHLKAKGAPSLRRANEVEAS